MLSDWDRQFPGRVENVFRAIGDCRRGSPTATVDFAALGSRSDARASAGDWLRGEPAGRRNRDCVED